MERKKLTKKIRSPTTYSQNHKGFLLTFEGTEQQSKQLYSLYNRHISLEVLKFSEFQTSQLAKGCSYNNQEDLLLLRNLGLSHMRGKSTNITGCSQIPPSMGYKRANVYEIYIVAAWSLIKLSDYLLLETPIHTKLYPLNQFSQQ